MRLIEEHRETYSALADEYERRAKSLYPVTEHAVKELARYLHGGRVLDVGCGVGLAVEVLKSHGFESSGIDISPEMVRYAQRRNPSQKIILGDFLSEDLGSYYDGVFAFAYIHLFPKRIAEQVLAKMHEMLIMRGVLYVGTTKSNSSSEGYLPKKDYKGEYKRFRKQWTKPELETSLKRAGFTVLKAIEIEDPYKKTWMDFIVEK